MILFFKAGWARWVLGAVALAAVLWWIHYLRPGAPGWTTLYRIPAIREWGSVAAGVGFGLTIEFAALGTVAVVGTFLFPNQCLRWLTREPSRLYSDGTGLSALAGGLMAALLEEPLFRSELQPEMVREAGGAEGYYLLALLFAACHWTPYTNLMAVWAFPRSLLFSYLYRKWEIIWVPMLAHGIGDFLYLYLFAKLGRQGLTHERPETPVLLK